MDNIYFRPIDELNEQFVRKVSLKTTQTTFIETVDECLAEAAEEPLWHPLAIYQQDNLIGFAMHGSLGPGSYIWIDRLIIDQAYQGLGLGKKAMQKLMEKVTNDYEVNVLYLSILPENKVGERLYTQLGFKYTNEKDPNGELIFEYTVR